MWKFFCIDTIPTIPYGLRYDIDTYAVGYGNTYGMQHTYLFAREMVRSGALFLILITPCDIGATGLRLTTAAGLRSAAAGIVGLRSTAAGIAGGGVVGGEPIGGTMGLTSAARNLALVARTSWRLTRLFPSPAHLHINQKGSEVFKSRNYRIGPCF